MEYYSFNEGKKVDYNIDLENNKIGEGYEGKIYLVDNKAIKIYKSYCNKERLDKEEGIYLSKIYTKRILTPNDVLGDENYHIKGFVSTYIENLGIENILNISSYTLKEELDILKEDIVLLSEYSVVLYDLLLKNAVFNNGIYLVDYGSFQIFRENKNVYKLNIERLNNFILFQFLGAVNYYLTANIISNGILFNNILDDFVINGYSDLIEYLKEDIKEDNLKKYLLKKNY